MARLFKVVERNIEKDDEGNVLVPECFASLSPEDGSQSVTFGVDGSALVANEGIAGGYANRVFGERSGKPVRPLEFFCSYGYGNRLDLQANKYHLKTATFNVAPEKYSVRCKNLMSTVRA